MEPTSNSSAMDPKNIKQLLRQLNLTEAGDASDPKKAGKKLEEYKFWTTQPVPQTLGLKRPDEENGDLLDGPLKHIDISKLSKEPLPLEAHGFEWCLLNLENEVELEELYQLMAGHYVEDTDGSFRFNYCKPFLAWALKPPGWKQEWHIGVRTRAAEGKTKGKLVAFISAVPISLRVRKTTLNASEVNFLTIHSKLRSKRLAPVLIKEVTRRCHLEGVFQALYTAGTLLPTPFSTCRYFHRSLDWDKLNATGFSQLPPGQTPMRMKIKYRLPDRTQTKGLRPMKEADIPAVHDLLQRMLDRYQLGQNFSEDEIRHWLCSSDSKDVVWAFVVEDPSSKTITDFVSYYILESTVVKAQKKTTIRAAYLYYYATETAFQKQSETYEPLKTRLNELVHDALILAKKDGFDVFNALTLQDNPLFLEQQKFGLGDGSLHYYLYNYRTADIDGGMNEANQIDTGRMGGIGVVIL